MRSLALPSAIIASAVVLSTLGIMVLTGPGATEYPESVSVSVTDEDRNVVVQVSGWRSFESVVDFANSHDIRTTFENRGAGIVTLHSSDVDESDIRQISSIPGVTSVSSEVKARTLFTPNDSSVNLQWGLNTVNAYEAWDITRGNHTVVVAILDTGIDWNHQDIAANIWSDEDGYHGYNFIDQNRIPMDDNVNSYDDNGEWIPNTYTYHGTHVAGVVGAVMDNSRGIAGIAQVQLMAVKVMNESGEGTDSTVASGIRYAVDPDNNIDTPDGADIITMSLGVDGMSSTLNSAVNFASSRGVIMVAASGNSGSSVVSYPAAYPRVIAVGAIDNIERRATFSNFGDDLDIMAPGVQIYSTQASDGYQYLSGTSTAAPYVAGIAALMLTVNPALSAEDVGSILNSTAKDISRTGYDTSTGWGIADAFRAVEQIAGPTVTFTDYPEYATPNSTFSVTWMVSGGDPGIIQSTYLRWGSSASSLTEMSPQYSGQTWATFTVSDIPSLPTNGTLYVRAFATVDGTLYESVLLEMPVHDAPPDGIFAQFVRDLTNFIMSDVGFLNFMIILVVIVGAIAIVVAISPRKKKVARAMSSQPQQLQQYKPVPSSMLAPPPPPPPRFEAYVDLMGHEVIPLVVKIYEGTKVVWVNRSWAPPPGIMIRSGTLDSYGEHPDGTFQSGMLIAPGDYWSATFHRPGEYNYYLTGIWRSAKIVVEPIHALQPGGGSAS